MLICFSLVLYLDRDVRLMLQKHWRAIFFLILIALLWRLPYSGDFFYGLEYEDAYVYSVSGRYLSQGVILQSKSSSPYLTTVCAVGSWKECTVTDTFSGHFIGYPYLVAILSNLLGFHPLLAPLVSFSAALLAIFPIFLVGKMMEPDGVTGEAGAAFYSIAPVIAVHGVGTYAEPMSNLLVICSLFFFMRLLVLYQSKATSALLANWLAFSCTALFALLVKRENILLLPVLVLAGITLLVRSYPSTRMRPYLLLLVVSACLSLVLALELQLFSTVESERAEFGVFPFSWRTLQTMLPLFARSFTIPGWYLLGFPFVMIGVVSGIRGRRFAIFPTALFVSYLLLYSSHVRSYYQLQTGAATVFDTIRYSINVAGLWSILCGVGFSVIVSLGATRLGVHTHRRFARAIIIASMLGVALWSYLKSDGLRKEMVDNELRVRIEPAQAAIRIARESGVSDTFVITLEPLLIHMLAAEPINVIDLRYLKTDLLRGLQQDSPNTAFLYLEGKVYMSKADRERYARSYSVLESIRMIKLAEGEEFSLYRLDLATLN